MRMRIPSRRSKAPRAASMEPLEPSLARMLREASPTPMIEVSLMEAVGLVIAEAAAADVDLPPFDRAATPGYAVRAAEAVPGVLLRVAQPWSADGHEIEPGESAWVEAGDAMPVGADAVLGFDSARADAVGSRIGARVIEVVGTTEAGRGVVRRGATLASGSIVADEGVRIRAAMVPLLASQGVVHPTCHRRVRVAIVAVGDHLVGPADAPVLHHVRNASSLAVGTLVVAAGGMVHDLGVVSEAELPAALRRALHSDLVVILGRVGDEGRRALARAKVEPTIDGIALEPGGSEIRHGVVRDPEGRVESHVLKLPLDPLGAFTAARLVVNPLLARLQGGPEPDASPIRVRWDGPASTATTVATAVPAIIRFEADGSISARPVSLGPIDVPDLARADGLALIAPEPTPTVGFVPFPGWSGA